MAGTEVAKKPDAPAPAVIEYKPFMSEDTIKLTANVVRNMICVPTKSGARCDDTQALKFMALCKARKLNPFEGDAYLIGYDTKDGPQFSLITAHQAFLKRAEVHPEYDGMKSGSIVKDRTTGQIIDREGDFTHDDDILLGAWATVYFKNRKVPMHKRIKLTTFKKGYGRWNDDPAGMLVKCAEADALRSSFPTQLGGMYLDDEMTRDDRPGPADYVPQDRVSGRHTPIGKVLENKKAPDPANPPAPETTVEPDGLAPNETIDAGGEIHQGEAPEDANQETPAEIPWAEKPLSELHDALAAEHSRKGIGAKAIIDALGKAGIDTWGGLSALLDDESKANRVLEPHQTKACRAALEKAYAALT